ncbi:hypothetical protein DRF58_11185 [Epilithonimonas hispanica]|uniref:Uncharacterized protein n=1 Tax=Epilithonimonas hispanica TaxID=358687 RepID=A0A3D9CW80_9FLAO|nr:hypothetical protein DRF58_11185 [Epilithonimonas hispanica]
MLGTFAYASSNVVVSKDFYKSEKDSGKANFSKSVEKVSECVTQSSSDCNGDTVTVTCCRTTFEEAYNCAAAKLKAAVFGVGC